MVCQHQEIQPLFSSEFRQFTVELWARPETPVTGADQIICERPLMIDQGNLMGLPSDLRVNFRVGIDAEGRPFAGYHGSGSDLIFVEAKATQATPLATNEWVHLAATYGGRFTTEGYWDGALRLYINGEMLAERAVNGAITQADIRDRGTILGGLAGTVDNLPQWFS